MTPEEERIELKVIGMKAFYESLLARTILTDAERKRHAEVEERVIRGKPTNLVNNIERRKDRDNERGR